MDRRMTRSSEQARVTRREAAAITGASLAAIDKAIEQRVLPVHRDRGQTLLDSDGVALIAIFDQAGLRLPVSVKRELRDWVVGSKPHLQRREQAFAVRGGPVAIRCTADVRRHARESVEYARLRDRYIVRDPDILAGDPVIKGTRLKAHTIAARLDDGDTVAQLHAEHPQIPEAALAVAYRYAKANPRRGRPAPATPRLHRQGPRAKRSGDAASPRREPLA